MARITPALAGRGPSRTYLMSDFVAREGGNELQLCQTGIAFPPRSIVVAYPQPEHLSRPRRCGPGPTERCNTEGKNLLPRGPHGCPRNVWSVVLAVAPASCRPVPPRWRRYNVLLITGRYARQQTRRQRNGFAKFTLQVQHLV
jgi:hypothetical protein